MSKVSLRDKYAHKQFQYIISNTSKLNLYFWGIKYIGFKLNYGLIYIEKLLERSIE